MTELRVTFECIIELAYAREDTKIGGIIEHLVDSVRDSIMGIDFKSYIPSVKEIRAACNVH